MILKRAAELLWTGDSGLLGDSCGDWVQKLWGPRGEEPGPGGDGWGGEAAGGGAL